MKALFDCELTYLPHSHLMQLYAGFFELEKKGIIKLKVVQKRATSDTIPITTAKINGKYTVVYDALDGLTWIYGDEDENLSHFGRTYNADFYFKRSYKPSLLEYAQEGCKVFPLGLNYNLQPEKYIFSLTGSVNDKIKYLFKQNKLLRKFSGKRFFYARDFEYYPYPNKEDKILFITRLWDPGEAKSERSRHFRQNLNNARVSSIETCKKKYGKLFTGGLAKDSFTQANFPSLVLQDKLTSKENFLNAVKSHSICIATTGLHESIGWKLAEYVAASRAIVSEPLQFQVPGDFSEEHNYLSFRSTDELIEKIDMCLSDREVTMQMMQNNYHYYANYVKPENLVLNTLLTIAREELTV